MKTVIVTPVANELDDIGEMYDNIQQLGMCGLEWVVVIDDYCTDGTDHWLRRRENPYVHIHDIGKGRGVAAAYIEGIKYALSIGADKIIEVDVGHPVKKVAEFCDLLNDVPLVMGNRYGKGGGFVSTPIKRRLISRVGTWVAKICLGLPFSDCTSGLQGFTRDVALKLPLDKFQSTGHFYQTEFKFYCREIPFKEVPFIYVGNNSSISNSSIRESIRILFNLSRTSIITWSTP